MLPLRIATLGVLSLALALPLVLVGCTRNDSPPPKTSKKPKKVGKGEEPKTAAGAPQTPGGWGSITGQLVYDGDVPAPVPLNLANHKDAPECRAAAKAANVELVKEEWVINKENKGIRWAVVFLTLDPPKKGARLAIHPDLEKAPDQKVVIDQPCCRFEPHVVAFREGQVVTVKNSANMAHALKWSATEQAGNSVTIPANSSREVKGIKAAEYPIIVSCGMHPWMGAKMFVFDHPYFAVTDENGRFTIDKVPAGPCRLIVWHDTGRVAKDRQGTALTIEADKPTDVGKIMYKK